MATYPLRTAISDTYPNPSNATARTGFGALYDFDTSHPFGQCRLVKSGANLVLQRFNGQWLCINDKVYSVPSAGVSLAASGLTPSTLYYIYAYMSGATMTLEASTTTYAADTTSGLNVKSTDVTRTLVGIARVITGPAWADTDAQRFVLSWFNRRPIRLYRQNGSAPTTGSATPVSLVGPMEFLTWADSCVPAKFVGVVTNSTVNSKNYTALAIDTSGTVAHAPTSYQNYAINSEGGASGGTTFVLSEGYHFAHTVGYVSGGSATWTAGIEMSGEIQG